MINPNWREILRLEEDDYSWHEFRVYLNWKTGDLFTLFDSGCSCDGFDVDTAEQSGPFYAAIEVLHDYTKRNGADVDGIEKIIRAVDQVKKDFDD